MEMSLSSLPPEFWFWTVLILLMTATTGFCAGLAYTKFAARLAVRRARSGLQQLYQSAVDSLDHAQEVCTWLDEFQGGSLSPQQAETLSVKQTGLLDTLSRVVQQYLAPEPDAPGEAETGPVVDIQQIPWDRSTVDPRSGLPDRSAFEVNAELLFQLGLESGLLLIKVDKFDQLKTRHTEQLAADLLKKLASVVCRAVRDCDIVCQYSQDTFALLLPGATASNGRKLAETIRDSVRHYHFRFDASGPEIFLTASFGFSPCEPNDNLDLAVNRAADALSRSERIGRNQLHLHNGQTLIHCRAQ